MAHGNPRDSDTAFSAVVYAGETPGFGAVWHSSGTFELGSGLCGSIAASLSVAGQAARVLVRAGACPPAFLPYSGRMHDLCIGGGGGRRVWAAPTGWGTASQRAEHAVPGAWGSSIDAVVETAFSPRFYGSCSDHGPRPPATERRLYCTVPHQPSWNIPPPPASAPSELHCLGKVFL